MSELAGFRSMSETLVAAASTFALFMAANWGNIDFLGDIFSSAFVPLLLPFAGFVSSVMNACNVSTVKSSKLLEELKVSTVKSSQLVEKMEIHGTIAIITVIPIYIRFPASALTSGELQNLTTSRGYARINGKNELKDVCPLELHPAANDAIDRDADVHNAINTNAAPAVASLDELATKHLEGISCMSELPRPGTTADAVININAPTIAVVDEEVMVLGLPAENIKEKEVLLRLGLAPTYKELSFLRSRNKFQTVVTGLQAGGYMLTVIQRAAQNLGISPVEAFVTFLCITVCVQLLMELYACEHYQRPLLLRLNSRQVRSLCVAEPRGNDFSLTSTLITLLIWILVWLLILGLAMYYFVHYVHTHLICSLSALFFFLAHVVPLILLPCTRLSSCWKDIILALYLLMYAGSLIVALVSTIVDWKAFREANQKAWYAWILPHVSS